MKRTKGFTLVELLVVISIIAVLLAVLIPSLNKARLISQRILCMNNARQQYLIQLTYAQSNDGKFAQHWTNLPYTIKNTVIKKNDEEVSLAYYLYKPYVKDSRIFICPALIRFAAESPIAWGMCRDTRWYSDKDGEYDKGGWDSTRPNSKELPNYICIPYNWYANLTPCAESYTDTRPYDNVLYYNKTKPFPKKTSECTSEKVVVSHIFMCDKGPAKFRDMGHGGSTKQWIDIRNTPIDQPPTSRNTNKMYTIDNPVVYADAHTEYVMKKDTRIRVRYDYTGNAKDAVMQIAW